MEVAVAAVEIEGARADCRRSLVLRATLLRSMSRWSCCHCYCWSWSYCYCRSCSDSAPSLWKMSSSPPSSRVKKGSGLSGCAGAGASSHASSATRHTLVFGADIGVDHFNPELPFIMRQASQQAESTFDRFYSNLFTINRFKEDFHQYAGLIIIHALRAKSFNTHRAIPVQCANILGGLVIGPRFVTRRLSL